MIMYLLMAAVATAAFFYGAYQKVQAQRLAKEVDSLTDSIEHADADRADRVARYESVIVGLKSRLAQLETTIYASNDPDAIRTLFGQLFPPASKP